MLPFDNKSEFQVVIDMPNGTTLEQTARVGQALEQYLSKQPEVAELPDSTRAFRAIQLQRPGTSLLFCGSQPNQADIQVNLLPTQQRERAKP